MPEKESNIRRNRAKNRPKSLEPGLLGAFKCGGRGKYKSGIMIDGKNKYLGYFCSPEEAHAAYVKAAKENGIPLPK